MANGYMEALQRKNNPSQNMKGVSVGVKTDIGQEADGLTADEQAMIDNLISTMSDKDKSFYKREVRSKMRSIDCWFGLLLDHLRHKCHFTITG